MNRESFNPYNFEISEEKPNSIWYKIFAVILIGIFIAIPLAKIDNSSFNYNEVYIVSGHNDCLHLKCILTSCQ